MVARGKLTGREKIGVRVGRVVNQYKVAKHFELDIHDDRFTFRLLQDRVASEAALDGLYVIRTRAAPATSGRSRYRAQLQAAEQCRAGLPLPGRRWI
jgi:hypothetical protein